MIVSHQHRFIFIKTRKTAGTSIELALSKIAGDDAIVTPLRPPEPGHGPRNYRGGLGAPLRWALAHPDGRAKGLMRVAGNPLMGRRRHYYHHMPAWLVRAKLGRRTWDSYFKFCFERNPWDKVASMYWWRTQHLPERPRFDEWVFADPAVISDWPLYSLSGDLVMDAVGRFESLTDDLDGILEQLGVSAELTLPQAKGGVRGDSSIYSPRAIEHVRRVFLREVETFGYEFPVALAAS